jgi:hypothetical protein
MSKVVSAEAAAARIPGGDSVAVSGAWMMPAPDRTPVLNAEFSNDPRGRAAPAEFLARESRKAEQR